jgi:GTP:adenosylcobinamide-phosphate guanylyltransferase
MRYNEVDAVVLAGDRRASVQVCGENKAFLQVRGAPLLIHVLRAMKRSNSVRNMVVVGPPDEVTRLLESYGLLLGGTGRIDVVEQGTNMLENFKRGYCKLMGVGLDSSFDALRGGELEDIPVLTVPCDVPLLTAMEVDEFVQRSNMYEYDYSIGITSERVLSRYHPAGDASGIQMIYFHVKEDLLRHNNLHLCKPLKLDHLDYVERMYEWRYQTRWANIVRMLSSMLFAGWRLLKGVRIFMLMQLSLYYDRHGHPRLSDRLRSLVPFNRLADGIGNALGARVQLVYTHFGGAALDVDNDEALEAIEERYDEWIYLQEHLGQE